MQRFVERGGIGASAGFLHRFNRRFDRGSVGGADLVARVGGIYSSRQNVRATVLNAATTTIEVTTGITNGQATTINVTEIGLFLFAMILGVGPAAVPFSTLMAYDGIASTPVASGGVIAPRYTMDFPV